MNGNFELKNVEKLLSDHRTVNFISSEPDRVFGVLSESFPDALCCLSERFRDELIEQNRSGSGTEFRKKFCDSPFLLLCLREEDMKLRGLMYELFIVMNMRKVFGHRTVLVTEKQFPSADFTELLDFSGELDL